MSKKNKSENNGSPPETNWTYCVKCVHFLRYLFSFFLVYHQVSLSDINGQNTQNIFILKGCQKKRTDNAKL